MILLFIHGKIKTEKSEQENRWKIVKNIEYMYKTVFTVTVGQPYHQATFTAWPKSLALTVGCFPYPGS